MVMPEFIPTTVDEVKVQLSVQVSNAESRRSKRQTTSDDVIELSTFGGLVESGETLYVTARANVTLRVFALRDSNELRRRVAASLLSLDRIQTFALWLESNEDTVDVSASQIMTFNVRLML